MTRRAAADPDWLAGLEAIDDGFRKKLEVAGLGEPLIWAGMRGDKHRLERLLRSMNLLDVDEPEATKRLEACLRLQASSREAGRDWVDGAALVTNTQLHVDLAHRDKRRRDEDEERKLRKLFAQAAQAKPVEWRSRDYRRAELAGDEAGRKRAEDQERSRWARRVVRLLVEAETPFGREVSEKGWDYLGPEAARALRGLRASSLRKRVGDIRPYLRWLQAELAKPFPTEADEVLRYFSVRLEEGAARTSFRSLLTALSFFEKAGEVPEQLQLSRLSSLDGAVREYEARRRLAAEEAGERTGKRQAPPLLLAILAAMEREVLDCARPLFIRAYAWYRLLRHWCSLRFDDTNGLSPAALQKRARGVRGVLTRTKTSGGDKSMTVLPLFVSLEAWVAEEWLLEGLPLWQDSDLGYKRDYFLCLPDRTFGSTCCKRARYSDAKTFSTALLSTLRHEDGDPLLCAEAVPFWSEHSDRTGLDTWLAALSVGSDMRRFVGRWAVTGSEDAYVRSSLHVTENCQRLAGLHAREAARGGPDYFGEEETLGQLKSFLLTAGLPEADADKQVERLRKPNFSKKPDPLATLTSAGGLERREAVSSSSSTIPVPPPCESDDDEMLDWDAPLGDEEGDLLTAAAQLLPDEPSAPMGFIVSKTRVGKCRRLHFAGGCFRIAGEHYKFYDDLGQAEPAEHLYNCRCSDCFPAARQAQRAVEAEFEASGSDGSSDSASSVLEGLEEDPDEPADEA